MTTTLTPPTNPLFSRTPTDAIDMGIDMFGQRVNIELLYNNLLIGGEPGGGKSVAIQNILAQAALSPEFTFYFLDGKLVELAPWAAIAGEFVGPDLSAATALCCDLQDEIDRRLITLFTTFHTRKLLPEHWREDPSLEPIIFCCDELALYTATLGTEKEREYFTLAYRDIVARGRAVGVIPIAATQRPSFDILPTSLRDLFSYKLALRCTTDSSSDTILGRGWAEEGYSAKTIPPTYKGAGYLLSEGGTPELVRLPDMSNETELQALIDIATYLRGNT